MRPGSGVRLFKAGGCGEREHQEVEARNMRFAVYSEA